MISPKASSISALITSSRALTMAVPMAATPATTPPMMSPLGPRVPSTLPNRLIPSVAFPPDCTSLPKSETTVPAPLASFPRPVVAVPRIFTAGPAAAAIPAQPMIFFCCSSSRSENSFTRSVTVSAASRMWGARVRWMVMPAVSRAPVISSMEPEVLSSMVSAIWAAAPSALSKEAVRSRSSSGPRWISASMPERDSWPNSVTRALFCCSWVRPWKRSCSCSTIWFRGSMLPEAS